MRTATLCLVFILMNGSSPKPRFKYVDKYVPTSLRVANLPKDEDDSVSIFLKDRLNKLGFKLVSVDEQQKMAETYSADVLDAYYKQVLSEKKGSMEEKIASARSKGWPSQSIYIKYISIESIRPSRATCDSVGFFIAKLPRKPRPEWHMWAMEEIGSRSADSVALFLLKNM